MLTTFWSTEFTITPSLQANNVLPITVNGALCSPNSYLNKPCVSVTICTPAPQRVRLSMTSCWIPEVSGADLQAALTYLSHRQPVTRAYWPSVSRSQMVLRSGGPFRRRHNSGERNLLLRSRSRPSTRRRNLLARA